MPIVGGLDIHRKQLTFDYLDTETGEVKRGQVAPADRAHLRAWLVRFAGRDDVAFALEGCTGWRYVTEELAAAGVAAHVAEPADTAFARGRKRHAKTDKTDSRHLRQLLAEGRLPECCASYLTRRCQDLADSLAEALTAGPGTQADVDRIVSYAERMALLGDPPGTTVGWLTYTLHYGHTLSGDPTVGTGGNPVLDAIATTCGLSLQPARVDDRTEPNARWLVTYTQGMMDTDALSDFIYGELYVPLAPSDANQPLHFRYRWAIPGAEVASVKAYACTFAAPFWRPYQVAGNERSYQSSDGSVITETLTAAAKNGYTYTVEGYPASDYRCSFSVSSDADDAVRLEWTLLFSCADPGDITRVVRATAHFTPTALSA